MKYEIKPCVEEDEDLIEEKLDAFCYSIVPPEDGAKDEDIVFMYPSMRTSITLSKQGNYAFHYNAPCLIVLANRKDYGNNMADVACCLENMMIMANACDHGSCWINQLKWLNENEEVLRFFETFGLKEEERIYGALALGYPGTENGLPERKQIERKGNEVTYIG